MKHRKLFEATGATGSALLLLIVGGLLMDSQRATAQNQNDQGNDDVRIAQGFAIAPVTLTLIGKNRQLVGLGSYLVNGVSGCNLCHSAGPSTEFLPGGNPFLIPGSTPPLFSGTTKINPATYLGGGRDFPLGGGAHVVSRNLTPDKTGLAVGGDSFAEFLNTIRTGTDPDQLHPFTCPSGTLDTCVPFPLNPTKLQIMPWPTYRHMTDHDLRAIYEYLSSVPCIPGPSDPNAPFYSVLHHDCGN